MTTTNCIKYRSGYKYQLDEAFEIKTGIIGYSISTDYAALDTFGVLRVARGYAWDGPSGPTIDRSSNMRGSLPHDVLYQFIREGFLPLTERPRVDALLLKCWKEDGMWPWLANIEVKLVKDLATSAARPSAEHMPKFAP
jgi:hypothetical protein